MKKVALLLFGISYLKDFLHWSDKYVTIDFRVSVDNYKTYIYEYFYNLGYEIDTFIATNNIDDDNIKNELINTYKPKKYKFIENHDSKLISRNIKIKTVIKCCLEYCKENNCNYDHCLITRFDLHFMKKFNESNIHLDKINIVSILEHHALICDNFYLFPFNLLKKFYTVITKNINTSSHYILNDLKIISEINFILSENKEINKLSFYKIIKIDVKKNNIIFPMKMNYV